MLRMAEVPGVERPSLRTMADAYWQEIMPNSPIIQDPTRRARYFETRFATGAAGGHQWWARLDELVVGFGNAQLLTDEAGDRYGYLKDFYIVPERRRKGHGRVFAGLIFQWMKNHRATRVSLHTRLDGPAATAFWQRLGCEPRMYIMRKTLD